MAAAKSEVVSVRVGPHIKMAFQSAAEREMRSLANMIEVMVVADNDGKRLCLGLVMDWAGWQKERSSSFDTLKKVLVALSSSDKEKLVPGELTRISLDDARDIPTIRMPYGLDTPVLHASAGIRRILSLAYVLVWDWEEHCKAAKLLKEETTWTYLARRTRHRVERALAKEDKASRLLVALEQAVVGVL